MTACAPIEGQDQPVHQRSLIRDFVVCCPPNDDLEPWLPTEYPCEDSFRLFGCRMHRLICVFPRRTCNLVGNVYPGSTVYSYIISKYNRTSLSRTRLFQITAYLEVKIWSLFKHETMTTGNKIMWKRGEIAPKEQFLLFSTLFNIYISNFRSQITYSLLNVVVQFIVLLTLSTLICRGTDISKYFSESFGIRYNKSRLYIVKEKGLYSFSHGILFCIFFLMFYDAIKLYMYLKQLFYNSV